MKNMRIFIGKVSVFGGEFFNIFEQACFRNVLVSGWAYSVLLVLFLCSDGLVYRFLVCVSS